MTSVIDASVAAKWVLPEEGTTTAEALLLQEGERIAPDFLLVEVGNILRTKLMRRQIEEDQMQSGFLLVRSMMHRFVPDGLLVQRAFEIAADCSHSVYDCMYVACAERERVRVITADMRFLAKMQTTPHAHLVQPLSA